MRRTFAALGAVVLVAVAVGCTPTQVAQGSCLARPDIRTFTGAQNPYDGQKDPATANTTFDASGASWSTAASYQIHFREPGGTHLAGNLCLVGGTVTTPYPDTDPWSTWHGRTGIMSEEPNTQIIGTRVSAEGDGLDFEHPATNWTVRGVHLSDIHDDCLQDDQMNSGLIDDSFFDGCFSGVSAMGFSGSTEDGTGNTITISNSLISLADMASVPSGTSPGHNGFFKFAAHMATEGRAPALVIRNTVFEADSPTDIGTMGLPSWQDATTGVWTPYLAACSNNTMVWLGSARYPKTLPSCFTVTTDRAVWDHAVSAWSAAHPGT